MGSSCCKEREDDQTPGAAGIVVGVGLAAVATPLLETGRVTKVSVRKRKGEKLGMGFEDGGEKRLKVKSIQGVAREGGLAGCEGMLLTEVNGVKVNTIRDMQPFARCTLLNLTFEKPLDDGPLLTKFPEPLKRYTPPSLDTVKSHTPPRVVSSATVVTTQAEYTVHDRVKDMFFIKKYPKVGGRSKGRVRSLLPDVYETAVAASQGTRRQIEQLITEWNADHDIITELLINLAFPGGNERRSDCPPAHVIGGLQNSPYLPSISETLSTIERLLVVLFAMDGPDLDYLTGHPVGGAVQNSAISLSDRRWTKTAMALQSMAVRHEITSNPAGITCHLPIPEATDSLTAQWAAMDGKYIVWDRPFSVFVGDGGSADSGLVLKFKNVRKGLKIHEVSLRPNDKEVLIPAMTTIRIDSVSKILKKSRSRCICKVVLTICEGSYDLQEYFKPVSDTLKEYGNRPLTPTIRSETSSARSDQQVPDYLRVIAKRKPKAEGIFKLNWELSIDGMPAWDADVYRISSVNGRWTVGKKGARSGQITAESKHNRRQMPNDVKSWARANEGSTWVSDETIKVVVSDGKKEVPPRKKVVPQPLQRPQASQPTASAKLFTPTSSPFDQPSTTVGPSFNRPLFTSTPSEPPTEPVKDFRPEQDAFWSKFNI
eukprot:TRINITY_DN5951_c0_g2_i2.p1 TRINITY_DN5951_c0_g2~~TRINITY_DN5951_c0_g2_i2.p1  ORF type:complete len:655 (+),score=88.08 TRINITY_DN5951_c0_g2_i2:522-2486(+)